MSSGVSGGCRFADSSPADIKPDRWCDPVDRGHKQEPVLPDMYHCGRLMNRFASLMLDAPHMLPHGAGLVDGMVIMQHDRFWEGYGEDVDMMSVVSQQLAWEGEEGEVNDGEPDSDDEE